MGQLCKSQHIQGTIPGLGETPAILFTYISLNSYAISMIKQVEYVVKFFFVTKHNA